MYLYLRKGSVVLQRVTIKRVEQRRRLRLFCKLALPANFFFFFVSLQLVMFTYLAGQQFSCFICVSYFSNLTRRFLNERSFGLG